MRTCTTKYVRYRDHKQALTALRKIRAASTREMVPTRAVPCPHCKGYHLSNRAVR